MAEDHYVGEEDEYNPDVVAHRAASAAAVIERRAETVLSELRARQEAVRRVLDTEDGKRLMADLKAFCRGDASAWHDNERFHALLTGRQEVYIRLTEYLRLPFDDLLALRSGKE